ncbi:hypothetical protein AB1Y20_010496 [Prymnesium parvum]|uniref:Calpain catalytic domain-containing protein n=1 Tax=Prymnesium parvum TaxID=97485 RepID=A0AB34IRN2_PRYPA
MKPPAWRTLRAAPADARLAAIVGAACALALILRRISHRLPHACLLNASPPPPHAVEASSELSRLDDDHAALHLLAADDPCSPSARSSAPPSTPGPHGARRTSRAHRRAEECSAVRRGSPPLPSLRLLEARSHAYSATARGEASGAEWTAMRARAASCVAAAELWRDYSFAHSEDSLGARGARRRGEVRWLSLRELYGKPHVWPDGRASFLYKYRHHAAEITDAAPPGDSIQGSVGDCYFLSAVTAAMSDLAVRRDLIDESLEAAGIYGVTFFLRGRWRMVWVDSYFPCHRVDATPDGKGAAARWQPLFASSNGDREAWLMVVEKAFAKLHGTYAALEGGAVASALALLTGGVPSTLTLRDAKGHARVPPHALLRLLQAALHSGFVIVGTPQCSNPEADATHGEGRGGILSRWERSWELVARRVDGMQRRLRSQLSFQDEDAVLEVTMQSGVGMVLLRDPWGGEGHADGEVWLSVEELAARFAVLYSCRVLQTTLQGGGWHLTALANEWEAGRAGGCPTHASSWPSNPQVVIRQPPPAALGLIRTRWSAVCPSPPQAERAHAAGRGAAAASPCGERRGRGVGHRACDAATARATRFWQVVGSSKYRRASHVLLELQSLDACEPYTLVASTFNPGEHAPFLLYIYASRSVDVDAPSDDGWGCLENETANGSRELSLCTAQACEHPTLYGTCECCGDAAASLCQLGYSG